MISNSFRFILIAFLFASAALPATTTLAGDGGPSAHRDESESFLLFLDKETRITETGAVEKLVAILDDKEENWHTRARAARTLAKSEGPKIVDALIDALDDTCPAIKYNAAKALGVFSSDPRAAAALISLLTEDSLLLREAAIEGLGKTNNPKFIACLLPALNDNSFAIRLSATKALGNMGCSTAVRNIKRVADADSDSIIRSEASSILKRLQQCDIAH